MLRGIYQYLLPLPIWQTIPPFIQLHIVAQSLHSFSRNEKEGKKWLPHNIRSNKRGKREEDSCKNSYQRDPIKLGSCLCGRQSLPRDRLAGSPSQQLAQLASPSSSTPREICGCDADAHSAHHRVVIHHTNVRVTSIKAKRSSRKKGKIPGNSPPRNGDSHVVV